MAVLSITGMSMNISYSPYSLQPRDRGVYAPGRGVLLRIEKGDSVGYADLHPWPSLGDLSIEEQLEKLKRGETTPQTRQSLQFAEWDAIARTEMRHLFDGLLIPKSHLFIGSIFSIEKAPEGSVVKVKMGDCLEDEIGFMISQRKCIEKNRLKFRIDFNEKLQVSQFESFLHRCEWLLPMIDFVEDPFSYDSKKWSDFQKRYKVSLAADRQSYEALGKPESSHTLIVKPAIQNIERSYDHGQQLVVTSYLDHPIGQLAAAYSAIQLQSKYPKLCGLTGLNSHDFYHPTPFSSCLEVKQGHLSPSQKGTGWGYDDLLKELKWISL